jgi:hypothetical protein
VRSKHVGVLITCNQHKEIYLDVNLHIILILVLIAGFVLQTKTAQIVGVAGTDIPIEDIKKLLLSHKVNFIYYFGSPTKSVL